MTHEFKIGDQVIYNWPNHAYEVTGIKADSVEITGDFSGTGICIQSDWVAPSKLTLHAVDFKQQNLTGWIETSITPPEQGVEVVGFHPDWINEDFNPNGTRACFLDGDETWYSARWCNYHDSFESENTEKAPIYWFPMPVKPIK